MKEFQKGRWWSATSGRAKATSQTRKDRSYWWKWQHVLKSDVPQRRYSHPCHQNPVQAFWTEVQTTSTSLMLTWVAHKVNLSTYECEKDIRSNGPPADSYDAARSTTRTWLRSQTKIQTTSPRPFFKVQTGHRHKVLNILVTSLARIDCEHVSMRGNVINEWLWAISRSTAPTNNSMNSMRSPNWGNYGQNLILLTRICKWELPDARHAASSLVSIIPISDYVLFENFRGKCMLRNKGNKGTR